jgi:hypothetical protein
MNFIEPAGGMKVIDASEQYYVHTGQKIIGIRHSGLRRSV